MFKYSPSVRVYIYAHVRRRAYFIRRKDRGDEPERDVVVLTPPPPRVEVSVTVGKFPCVYRYVREILVRVEVDRFGEDAGSGLSEVLGFKIYTCGVSGFS